MITTNYELTLNGKLTVQFAGTFADAVELAESMIGDGGFFAITPVEHEFPIQ